LRAGPDRLLFKQFEHRVWLSHGVSSATASSTAAATSKVTLVVYSAQGYDSAMTKASAGLAGELPVRVRGRGTDGTVLVEPMLAGPDRQADSFLARSPLEHLTGALQAGDGALMMIRPTGVRLCANGSAGPGGSAEHQPGARPSACSLTRPAVTSFPPS
jgi:hypothetical protein